MSIWCSKHVEAWNKLTLKQKFCASSWLITEINALMLKLHFLHTISLNSDMFRSIRRVQPTRRDVSQFIYFCKTLYMFQSVIHQELKTAHTASGICHTNTATCYRLKHVERLTEINKLRDVASCWLYCTNILAMHRPVKVKSFDMCSSCLTDIK